MNVRQNIWVSAFCEVPRSHLFLTTAFLTLDVRHARMVAMRQTKANALFKKYFGIAPRQKLPIGLLLFYS